MEEDFGTENELKLKTRGAFFVKKYFAFCNDFQFEKNQTMGGHSSKEDVPAETAGSGLSNKKLKRILEETGGSYLI